jgi:hypothetical protein
VAVPPPALSTASVALAAAGVVSVVLTTAGMVTADLRHAPACATTLIVSLGLLPSLADAAIIGVAILVLLATHRALLTAAVAPAPSSAGANRSS